MYKFLKHDNFYLQFLYRLIIKCVKPNQQKKKRYTRNLKILLTFMSKIERFYVNFI